MSSDLRSSNSFFKSSLVFSVEAIRISEMVRKAGFSFLITQALGDMETSQSVKA